MNLILSNHVIKPDIPTVLQDICKRVPYKNLFQVIEDKGDYYRVTCPIHKNGQENKPSCSIFKLDDDSKITWGTCHCFTCGYKAQFPKMVADCLGTDITTAEEYLIENYSDSVMETFDIGESIVLGNNYEKPILPKLDIDQYKYFHPYMFRRGLTEDIIRKFSIGYNVKTDSIVFPVWDEKDNLVTITERSVTGKRFHLQADVEKPVYLLNFALKEHHNQVIVCEGQFDALVAWTYGFPAVSLFGSGTTDYQMDILNKCDIQHFILMYDNDPAGRKGATRFKRKIRQDRFVTDILMPPDKDIAECSKEEFYNILKKYNIFT